MTGNLDLVLLDTSVWIDALRGKTPDIVTVTQELLNDDRVLTCGLVIFEIKRGLRPPERKKILPLFDALIRLSFDETVWDSAGDLDCLTSQKRHYYSANGCHNRSDMPASQGFSLYPG